jgi:predicted kinase/nucleoside 2-deoxyribosyltransferase
MFQHLPESGLVILLGAPGSGKTTFSRLAFPKQAIVSSIALRAILGDQTDTRAEFDQALSLIPRIVSQRLTAGLLTVVDLTASRRDVVDNLISIAAAVKARIAVIYLNTDVDVCVGRNATAGKPGVSAAAIRRFAEDVEATATDLRSTGVPVSTLDAFIMRAGNGRRVFLAMPVTENIGHSGFRLDKRRYYERLHEALRFGGFEVASAAVNEDYGTVNLEPDVFTRYDLEKIADCDCLVVATPTTASPDVYLEIGLAVGAGKPVGMVLPARGRMTAMMRGLIDLGVVHKIEFEEDDDLPRLALQTALTLTAPS